VDGGSGGSSMGKSNGSGFGESFYGSFVDVQKNKVKKVVLDKNSEIRIDNRIAQSKGFIPGIYGYLYFTGIDNQLVKEKGEILPPVGIGFLIGDFIFGDLMEGIINYEIYESYKYTSKYNIKWRR